MSHTRFELGFSRHKKVNALSDAAFRLWVSAMDRAREQASDGAVDAADLDLVPRCPLNATKRAALVRELTISGLWEVRENGWQIHDYLDWQDSAEEIKARRENARHRMRKVREKLQRTASVTTTEVRTGTSDSYSYSESSDSGDPAPEARARAREASVVAVDSSEDPGEDPGRETICPLDLADRLEKNGTLRRLAEQLPAPLESVRACARGFVGTWTIGKLAGQRRGGWAGRLRQWVIDQHTQGKLRPPGAVEHDTRSGAYVPPDDGLAALCATIGRGAR